MRAAMLAIALNRFFQHEPARALFVGCAAHVFRPLSEVASSAVGTMMIAAGHRHGRPMAQGGRQPLRRRWSACWSPLAGVVVTGARVARLTDLPPHRIAIFDVAPRAFAEFAGNALVPRRSHAYWRFRHGPVVFKLDLAVSGGVPWSAPAAGRAGTVHVGGSAAEIAEAEALVCRGVTPEQPFVLVAQQHIADPSRTSGDVCPVYAYAHVPDAYTGDAAPAIIEQIERFAPGFGERILQVRVTTPGAFERVNPQLRGRRHRRRFQYPAGHCWATRGVNEQLRDLAPRGLPMLRLDSTRRRDPWHVRVPRRSDGAGGSALTSAQRDWKFF